MKDRKRDSLGEEFLDNLEKEGVIADGRGTFQIGQVQIPASDQPVLGRLLFESLNNIALKDGETAAREIVDASTEDREKSVGKVLDLIRKTKIGLIDS